MKFAAIALLGIIGLASEVNIARADVIFSFSGTWDSAAPSTLESAPNASVSFSFDLPDLIATDPTSQATDFVYDLNDNAVSATLVSVLFYPLSEGGMFDLDLSDGDTVNLYGVDVGSSLTILPGTYTATIDFDLSGYPTGLGSGTLDITNVPEPMSLCLFGGGMLAFGLLRRRKRNTRRIEAREAAFAARASQA